MRKKKEYLVEITDTKAFIAWGNWMLKRKPKKRKKKK
jgi:hypothetical protein